LHLPVTIANTCSISVHTRPNYLIATVGFDVHAPQLPLDPTDARPALGAWCSVPAPFVAELLGHSGVEYVCLDTQHGLIGPDLLPAMLGSLAGCPVTPLVRVPSLDFAAIGRALDAGAGGVIIPMIDSAADAAAAAAACRFPPRGRRSYGPTRAALVHGESIEALDAHVRCIPMIETAAALADIDAICATPGVDGVYAGPVDLAISLGIPLADIPRSAEHAEALAVVVAAARRAGIFAGLHCTSGRAAQRAFELGFTMATGFSDTGLLRAASSHVADARRAATASP
jgi:4-hydroxy-2-oxoheptanedioate aldolase